MASLWKDVNILMDSTKSSLTAFATYSSKSLFRSQGSVGAEGDADKSSNFFSEAKERLKSVVDTDGEKFHVNPLKFFKDSRDERESTSTYMGEDENSQHNGSTTGDNEILTLQCFNHSKVECQLLGHDQWREILFFLDGKEACTFRRCCRFADSVFHSAGEYYWKALCGNKFKVDTLMRSQQSKFYAQYLYFHMNFLQNELAHIKSLEQSYEALGNFFGAQNDTSRVYGMVCDLAWLDDERLAAVLSKNRCYALPTIIVEQGCDIVEFKKLASPLCGTGATTTVGPASFLPLSVALGTFSAHAQDLGLDREHEVRAQVPGFLGFAVNMFRLRPEHERIRYPVLSVLFKNLMVFDTMDSKLTFEATLDDISIANFRGVALDEYADEALSTAFPRFRAHSPRPLYYIRNKTEPGTLSYALQVNHGGQTAVQKVVRDLARGVERTACSYAIVRYSY